MRPYSSQGLVYLLNSKQIITFLSAPICCWDIAVNQNPFSHVVLSILQKKNIHIWEGHYLKTPTLFIHSYTLLTSLFPERNTVNLEHVLSLQNLCRNTCVLFIVFVLFCLWWWLQLCLLFLNLGARKNQQRYILRILRILILFNYNPMYLLAAI